ncbi:hypothetical protein [Dyella sp.]|uniref:hypothetical protein n=1 Tax=Dyella sp. TaxID=1869338 RepID=UPI002D7926B2|nr:hypothetical protein [Dyella sp.]HET7331086.1 hypothetical protein [Dyella sp.]
MKARLLSHEVAPFLGAISLLVLAALGCDAALHWLGITWVGRYLGIPGFMLILASFVYSLRKHQVITVSSPAVLLRWHQRLAWSGALLVLVHAGIHFNTLLGWLAVGAMMVNIVSGLTGKILLRRARVRLETARMQMQANGAELKEIEDELYWDSFTFDAVSQWRAVHRPITLAFMTLALAHIVSILLLWGWK